MNTGIDPARLPCAAGTLRRASRSLVRLYDSHLAGAGFTTTQFSILRTLQRHRRPMALTRLADELVFERTSLYRALEPLRRERLIGIQAGRDRRVREVVLTTRGRHHIARALPSWKAAQRAILGPFGVSAWRSLSGQLGEIARLARGVAGATER